MDGIFVQIVIILAMILVNGVFAMSEIAVVSARKPRLQYLTEAGSDGAHAALEMFQTVGGFVMMFLGRIPSTGDRIDFQGLQMEVVDMDGNRVDKVVVKKTS